MLRKLRVLIVDDNSTDAELMLRELRRAGFEPEWTRVDTEVEFTDSLRPDLDIILCDYAIPGFSGLRAIEVLRERGLDIPLIIVSGTIDEATAVATMQQGATDYILKDRLLRLAPAVAFALDKRHLRKRGEQTLETLRESQARLEAALASMTDAVFISDAAGRFIEFNDAFASFHRFKNKAECARSLADYPEILEVFTAGGEPVPLDMCAVPRALRGETVTNAEYTLRRKDTGETWVGSYSFSPIRDKEGAIVGSVVVGRDITERKRAEEAHARLATAIEQAHESIVITDVKGVIQYVNPFFERASGYSKEEAIGQNPRILKSGRHDDPFYRRMWETIAHGAVWHGRMTNKRKDGTLFEEDVTISPIVDGAGKTVNYVAVKRDISREVQLEAQFLQAQKMEAIGQLAGGVAHDFNNILAAILIQTELIATAESLPDSIRDGLLEISAYADRAASLTRQLLMFSCRQEMRPRGLDLNELVTNLVQMLRRIIGEDVRMELNLHSEPLTIYADPGMLDQVLLNLVVNARDAMPGGGRLFIETGRKTFTVEEADLIPGASPGCKACLRVTDTGSGIAPDILARIFEPFFTTKDLGKGTGLGLATVFGIVKQHGGSISVESEVGRGTTFQVFLPATEKISKLSDDASVAAKPTEGTETVLLVEDEQVVRILIRLMLVRAGYKVLEASDGVEAERIWGENQDLIDLLLTDIVLPEGMNGHDLAARIQARKPQLRVLFMSGYNVEVAARQLSLREGQNFVQKPFSAQQLMETVRQSLDG